MDSRLSSNSALNAHRFDQRVIVKEEDIKDEEYGHVFLCQDEDQKHFTKFNCKTETDIAEFNVPHNETFLPETGVKKEEDELQYDPLLETFPTVLILGSSYVCHGEERARRTVGRNLGTRAQVEWLGSGGMRWHSVVPRLMSWLNGRFPPDVLLIHCGGNDLGELKSVDLVAAMKRDLQYLHQRFPKMRIVYSAITQRCRWGSVRPKRIEHSRKWVNSEMASFILGLNGIFVRHDDIRFYKPELFVRDQVHLSARGNDIFINSFLECLRALFPWE